MAKDNGLTTFFKERVDFGQSEVELDAKEKKMWKLGALTGWPLAIALVVVVAAQGALKELIPISVIVDRSTGVSEVTVGRQKLDIFNPSSETQMIADVGRYVRARESFTRGEADSNYKTLYYMTAADGHGELDKEFRAELNPRALILTMRPEDSHEVRNMSVSFLPSDSNAYRTAQVRFDKIKRVGSAGATTQRFQSTITFYYDVANVPTTVEGIVYNHAGFTKLNYRRDKETEESPLAPVAAPVQDKLFSTGAR